MTNEPPPVVTDGFVQLICVVTGVDPPDNITWTFRDSLVYFTTETTGANITLGVGRSYYGVYTCTAANEFGVGLSSVTVSPSGMLL